MNREKIYQAFSARVESDRFSAVVFAVYAAFCFASGLRFAVLGDLRGALMGFCFLLFLPALWLIERLLAFRTPPLLNLLLFGMIAAGILGAAYDIYAVFPPLDVIQHGLSGIIFAAFGFGLMKRLLRVRSDRERLAACLIFAFCFSMAVAALWELFEYGASAAFGLDMNEDTVVYSFRSYLLAGSHAKAYAVDGIDHTVIHFRDGKTLAFDGYLDLGLIDTMGDMAICLAGDLLFVLAAILGCIRFPGLASCLIPRTVDCGGEKTDARD